MSVPHFSIAQRLLAAGAACLVALVGLVVLEARARAAGVEVILPMQPVDPRGLLTGHYIRLSFADRLDAGRACPPLVEPAEGVVDWRNGPRDNWLALKREGDVHVLAGEFATRAQAAAAGDVVVRGRARCSQQFWPSRTGDGGEEAMVVVLELGVDRFHADQDEAETLEKILRDRDEVDRMAAILSVSPDGAARTKGVALDGKRVELTWF